MRKLEKNTKAVILIMKTETKHDNGMRTYSLEYQNEKKGTARTVELNLPVMRARLRYLRDYQPEVLMDLLNSGKLYLHLLRLFSKVESAVERQVQMWQETDKEYLAAEGDFFKQYAILQRMRMEAEHQLYDAMVYV